MAFAIALSGAAIDTLNCLFMHGPTYDGDVPSKSGRDDLVIFGLAARHEGFQWLTRAGVIMALENGLDREKERRLRFSHDGHRTRVSEGEPGRVGAALN